MTTSQNFIPPPKAGLNGFLDSDDHLHGHDRDGCLFRIPPEMTLPASVPPSDSLYSAHSFTASAQDAPVHDGDGITAGNCD